MAAKCVLVLMFLCLQNHVISTDNANDDNIEELIREIDDLLHEDIDIIDRKSSTNNVRTIEDYKGLRIGAFNIQIFGENKMNKEHVVDALLEIIPRYDILLVQEIRDKQGKAIGELIDKLESEKGVSFELEISDRLGRTSSKEQYGFMYRPDVVHVVDTYQYDAGRSKDDFQRPPFAVLFYSPITALSEFGLVGIHTDPDEADKEVDSLADVYEEVQQAFGTENIITLGDFNADCSYVTESDWSKIRFFADKKFTWIIGDEADTTTSGSNCAYDRFVLAGERLKYEVVPDSIKVYRFDEALGLDDDTTEDVSDHYPVELILRASDDDWVSTQSALILSITKTLPADGRAMEALLDIHSGIAGYETKHKFQHNLLSSVKFTHSGLSDPVDSLKDLFDVLPDLATDDFIDEIADEVNSGILGNGGEFVVELKFKLGESITATARIQKML